MESGDIENWLDRFCNAWESKDLTAVEKLFAPAVEYWETPFKKLDGISEVMSEWKSIVDQEDIKVQTSLLAMDAHKATVEWNLSYIHNGENHQWAGLYLIELNNEKQCCLFRQVGEENK